MLKDMKYYPIGGYNWMSASEQGAEAVADWRDLGLTLMFSPGYDPERDDKAKFLALLDEAAKNNIKLILHDARSSFYRLVKVGEERYRADLAEAVKDFGSHPAAFGFNVGDEPSRNDFAPLKRAFEIQYELAPHLTPFSNLFPYLPSVENQVGYTNWSSYLDEFIAETKTEFLSYDCYTQMFINGEREDAFFENLRLNHDAAKKRGIPMWSTLLSTGHYNYKCPDEDEIRWQLSNAAAHGAKGIMWYFIQLHRPYDSYKLPPIDELGQRTETFEWLARANKTFLKSFGGILLELELKHVMHLGKALGGYPPFGETEHVKRLIVRNGVTAVVSEFEDKNGETCVAVVNNSKTKGTIADITLKGESIRIFSAGWNEKYEASGFTRDITSGTGMDHATARLELGPGQLALIKPVKNGGK